MTFNSRTGKHPSIPGEQDCIRRHPLELCVIRRDQLILRLVGTLIILHRMVSQHTQQRYPHPHRMKALLAKVTLLRVSTRRRKFKRALGTWMDTSQDRIKKTRRAAYVFTYTTSGASESFYLRSYSNKCMPSCTAALGSRHQFTARVRNLISAGLLNSFTGPPFKGGVLTFKILYVPSPEYLKEVVTIKENSSHNCNLRSNNRLLFETPSIKSKKTFGESSFKMAAPAVWNKLPSSIRNVTNLDKLNRRLRPDFSI